MKTLKAFANWYLRQSGQLPLKAPGENAIRKVSFMTEVVIYRDPPFQVEFVTLIPGQYIPPHHHPNVDSYDISLTGNGEAVVSGRVWTKQIQAQPRVDLRIPVLAGAIHYGFTFNGAAFISIQKWKNGVPLSFLSEDWIDAEDWPLVGGINSSLMRGNNS